MKRLYAQVLAMGCLDFGSGVLWTNSEYIACLLCCTISGFVCSTLLHDQHAPEPGERRNGK